MEDCLQEFISYLNSSNGTIKFTSEYSDIAVNFLDVSIKVGVGEPWGPIFLQAYRYPTVPA